MSCEAKVSQALEGLPGVKTAAVSHPEKNAVIHYDPASVTIEQMCQTLLKSGYVAALGKTDRTMNVIAPDESRGIGDYKTDDLICYCFGYTRGDIEQDFTRNNRSLIMEKIVGEKKMGGCDCANNNPKKR